MALSLSFGQYIAGDTPLHRLDGRVKFLLAMAYTYAVFASRSWVAISILGAIMVIGYVIARVPARLAVKSLKPIAVILVFTVLANALSFSIVDGQTAAGVPAVSIIRGFGFKPSGLADGIYYALRIGFLVVATSLVTFTTSAVALADALSSLMRPLRRIHVPVDDVATMFSITLRFIPITSEEAMRIQRAQRARGAEFDEGGLMKRVRAWIPVLVPLFVGLFRRADDLASAMDARCYTGVGRVRLEEPHMRVSDWMVLVVGMTACVSLGVVF